MMSGTMLRSGAPGVSFNMFPNTIAQIRDKSHSTEKMLQDPFAGHPQLNEVLQTWGLNTQTAFISIIFYSGVLASMFSTFCAEAGTPCESLSYAKHRFKCIPQVLSIYVKFRMPLLRVCQYIVDTREPGSQAYKAAVVFVVPDGRDVSVVRNVCRRHRRRIVFTPPLGLRSS